MPVNLNFYAFGRFHITNEQCKRQHTTILKRMSNFQHSTSLIINNYPKYCANDIIFTYFSFFNLNIRTSFKYYSTYHQPCLTPFRGPVTVVDRVL